jgi:enamine deaminase RidA (YjgF/YER057c/UK114 family)
MAAIVRTDTQQRMSKIVEHNGTVYLCGQVAEDATKDVAEQTRSMLARVDALLLKVGTTREKILSATIYLADIGRDFAAMNEVWDAWVPEGHAPARACVEGKLARAELLVEVVVVAAK